MDRPAIESSYSAFDILQSGGNTGGIGTASHTAPTLFRHSVFGTRGVDEFDSNDTFETSNRTIREVRDLPDEDDGLLLN